MPGLNRFFDVVLPEENGDFTVNKKALTFFQRGVAKFKKGLGFFVQGLGL